MPVDFALGVGDYLVISTTMLISVLIGIYFSKRQGTADAFLMADRNMTRFPVTLSLVATKMSAITLLGAPSETFLYGTQRLVGIIFYPLGSLVAAYVFLPPFYAVDSPSIYAYLEYRFGQRTRRIVSTLCFIQTYFFLSIVLYAPALALDAVTSLSLDTSVILMGIVTTLFSVMGGMKAVMWADVFQTFCMFSCLFAVMIFGFQEVGFYEVYSISREGGRLDWFNFSTDLGERYTFWNSLLLSISPGVVAICISQMEMQRAFSIRKLKDAQSSFLWSSIPTLAIVLLTNTIGLIMFALFSRCNPLAHESGVGLGKADQIVPYYIVSRMTTYPGLAGLCVSGLFCGSISSMSSAVNSMSTTIIDDFIRPMASLNIISKLNFAILAKALVAINGAVVTCLPLVFAIKSGLLKVSIIYNVVIYTPVFSVYLLGMLTETANEKGTSIGMICGVALTTWISVGAMLTGKHDSPTSLTTDECSIQYNLTFSKLYNASFPTTETLHTENTSHGSAFPLYRLSFAWTGTIGMVTSFVVGYIASLLINHFNQGRPSVESHLLSPVTKYWIKQQRTEESEFPLRTKNEDVDA